jgi:branched-chain amino acid transport system ATP-binding protein
VIMTRTDEILRVRGLSKQFDGLRAADGLDLTLQAGELVGLIGPNGAGKTTLLNLLAGQLRPDSGSIFYLDREITRWPAHRRARLGLARTFQITALFPELTVREHLLAALQRGRWSLRWPAEVEPQVHTLARRCRIDSHLAAPAGALSHGDRRLLELAVALALRPKLLLLDEPTAGLSPAETRALVDLVAELEGLTRVIVEHDMDVVFELAERVIVMHRGRVLAEGAPDEIQKNPEVQAVYLGTS